MAPACLGGECPHRFWRFDLSITGPPLGAGNQAAEVKGSFPQSRWPGHLSGFALWSGSRRRQISVVAGFPRSDHDDHAATTCVARSAISGRTNLGAQTVVMESKCRLDRRRTIENARVAAEAVAAHLTKFAHKAAKRRCPLPWSNRHCPSVRAQAAKEWFCRARGRSAAGSPYFHAVFALPAAIADIAYQTRAVIYDILFTT